MEKVKVIIWGLGAMGGGMADMLLKKEGVEIVGAVGRGAKIGKSMFDVNLRFVIGLTRLSDSENAPKTWQGQLNVTYWFL